MKNSKLVTIIIPTFKRPKYLIRAITSVFNQTYKNTEIIIVDDNGENTAYQKETETILKSFIEQKKIKYIVHDKNRNGSAARNTGIQASNGDFITFLDDDDILYPQKIEKQVKFLENNNKYGGVYTGFEIILNSKRLKSVTPHKEGNLQYDLLSTNWSIGTGSNPMFRREVFTNVGLFDITFIRHQDIEFLVRFFRIYTIGVVPEILISRYIDDRDNKVNCKKLIQVKEKFLATFKEDIGNYEHNKQHIILRAQYADIACHAMQEKEYKLAFNFYKKANSYKLLSLKIIAKAIAYGLFNYKVE